MAHGPRHRARPTSRSRPLHVAAVARCGPICRLRFPTPVGGDAHRFRGVARRRPVGAPAARRPLPPGASPAGRRSDRPPGLTGNADGDTRIGYGWNVVGYFSSRERGRGGGSTDEPRDRRRPASRRSSVAVPSPFVAPAAPAPSRHREPPPVPRLGVLRERRRAASERSPRIEGGISSLNRSPSRAAASDCGSGRSTAFPDRWQRGLRPARRDLVREPVHGRGDRRRRPDPGPVVAATGWTPSAPTPFQPAHSSVCPMASCSSSASTSTRCSSARTHSISSRPTSARSGRATVRRWSSRSINGAHRPGSMDAMRQAAAGRGDIVLLDGYIDPHRVQASSNIATASCRSTAPKDSACSWRQAMAMGRPVIATGYSGNMAFMDRDSAFLVPYEPRAGRPGQRPLPFVGTLGCARRRRGGGPHADRVRSPGDGRRSCRARSRHPFSTASVSPGRPPSSARSGAEHLRLAARTQRRGSGRPGVRKLRMRIVLVADVGGPDGYHAGDEAMLDAAIDALRQRAEVDITVVSRVRTTPPRVTACEPSRRSGSPSTVRMRRPVAMSGWLACWPLPTAGASTAERRRSR